MASQTTSLPKELDQKTLDALTKLEKTLSDIEQRVLLLEVYVENLQKRVLKLEES